MDHRSIDERALVSRYVAGQLSPDDSRDFEAHFVDCATCLEHLEREQQLRAALMSLPAAAPGVTSAAPRRLSVRTLATAAVVVLAVGATAGYVQERRRLEATTARVTALEREHAPSPATAGAPPAHVTVFELDTTRGTAAARPTLTVPRSTSLVVFSLAVGNAADYSRFAATVESAAGSTLLRENELQSASPTSVAIAIDAHDFVDGDYTIVLEGAIRNRAPAIIAQYPLHVVRR